MKAPVAIGIAALFVWAHGLLGLWPLPQPTENIPPDMQWSLWWETAVLTSLGLVAGVLAVRRVKWWWMAIVVTSGIVLFLNLPAMISDIGRAQSFRAWFLVLYDNVPPGSLYFLLVIPLYHLGLTCSALIFKVAELGVRAKRENVA